eukprot:4164998-Pyramimonas_sp.AAC.1
MCVECSHWVVDWTCGSQARLQKECLREEAESRKRQEKVQALNHAKEQAAEAERLKKVRLFRRHERTPPETGRSSDPG